MKKRSMPIVTVLLMFSILFAGCAAPSVSQPDTGAYVEPGLSQSTAESLSVIVTATEMRHAARAVKKLGGEITNELHLINAVGATLPATKITQLSQLPGIVSIVHNKGVNTAESPSGENDWDGWANRKRYIRKQVSKNSTIHSPVSYFDNGAFLALSANGDVTVTGPDTETISTMVLPGDPFVTQPQLGTNGLLYVAGMNKAVHAISSDGVLQWTFDDMPASNELAAGVALAQDGTVYVVDIDGLLYALDGQTGQLLWTHQPAAADFGEVDATPTVAADGTIYYVSEGNKEGQVFAVNADGTPRWTFVAPDEFEFSLPAQVGSDGSIYVASENEAIFVLNVDGTLRFATPVDGEIEAQPLLAQDGSLYVATVNGNLIALRADGSQAWTYSASEGGFLASPLLTADGATLIIAANEGPLLALSTTDGSLLWQYQAQGDILSTPTLDVDHNIVFGSEGKDLVTLTADGGVVSVDQVGDGILQTPSISPFGKDVTVRIGEREVVTVGRLPESWDISSAGFQDIRPSVECDLEHVSADCLYWEMVNPLSVDIGADQVHDLGIRGAGVTVAVIDSGVHFDRIVKAMLSHTFDANFLGQADFVNRQCALDEDDKIIGIQQNNHCFQPLEASRDVYGHGSHVAGIIFNPLQDITTGTSMGVAPAVNYLSVRVLGADGRGTYADAIEGIQYVVDNKDQHQIRILNLSLSAYATTPYFVDPLNQAVERAWAEGIVVVAAAGNSGPGAESITVPGNDPYVITVGAIDGQRTPGFWHGDTIASWSASGPTLDGFVKPDIVAPGAQIISLMYYDPSDPASSAALAVQHPDHSENLSLFRMNGTSMATAVVSGVAALMLEAHPNLTPDEVKFRLGYSARPAITDSSNPLYNIFQQGMGRLWAPTAVFGDFPADAAANQGMDLADELADYEDGELEISRHYQGPVRKLISDDGSAALYYIEEPVLGSDGEIIDSHYYGLGAMRVSDREWMDWEAYTSGMGLWSGGMALWSSDMNWAGGVSNPPDMETFSGGMGLWSGGMALWSGGMALWSGGIPTWAGGMGLWSGGMGLWSGGIPTWAGGMSLWSGGMGLWSSSEPVWAGSVPETSSVSLAATTWVGDDGLAEPTPEAPTPEPPTPTPEPPTPTPEPPTPTPEPPTPTPEPPTPTPEPPTPTPEPPTPSEEQVNGVTIVVASADTFVNEDKENENKGDDRQLKIRTEAGKMQIGLLQFSLDGLPTGATVDSAELLIVNDRGRDNHPIEIRRMQTEWTEMDATWQSPNGSSNWAAGAFGPSDYSSEIYATALALGDKIQIHFDVTDLVAAWTGGAPNYGVAMLSAGNDDGETKWFSRDEGDPERRPVLVVHWSAPSESMSVGNTQPLQTNAVFLPTVHR